MSGKQKVGMIIAAGVISLGCYVGYQNYFYVSTDNAMVQAHTTLLSSKVSGIIVKVSVQENEKVKAGQVLVEIKSDDYQTIVNQLQAESDSLAAQVHGASTTFHRTQELYHKGAATQERLDMAETQLLSLQEKFKAAEAQLAAAKLNLEYTKVLAPTDGTVGRKSVEVGMLANMGQPLMGFVEGEKRWVVANLKETDMENITQGKRAYISVDAISGKDFEGVIESISPTTGATFSLLPPDNATGNFTKVVQRVPVRIKLLKLSMNDVDRLQSGLSAEVKIRVR